MNRMMFFAFLLAAGAASGAGSMKLDESLYVGDTDELLQYDDGSAYWLTWAGLYRGVWFDITDFDPYSTGFSAVNSQYWFYHHSSYPWDTSCFYAELWNGVFESPINRLNQTSMTALHYTVIVVDYPGGYIGTEGDFLSIVNTSMSSGGWPSILGDNSAHDPSHSFFSDDFIVWEPWLVGGATANDYFIRMNGFVDGLASASWGAIKGLYR